MRTKLGIQNCIALSLSVKLRYSRECIQSCKLYLSLPFLSYFRVVYSVAFIFFVNGIHMCRYSSYNTILKILNTRLDIPQGCDYKNLKR